MIFTSPLFRIGFLTWCLLTGLFSPLLAQTAEEVTFSNGEINLAGTLSFPDNGARQHKAIVLVSGSGPQDRDSDIEGFKTFQVLADTFNAMGYAVLRFDDRGTGQSGGPSTNESTTQELAEDARQAFIYLRSRKDIDPSSVGMLGHSEGGAVVPMVAAQENDMAFAILLAGYGVRGVELTNAQQRAILTTSGLPESFIEASGTMNREVMRMMNDETITSAALRAFVKAETLKLLTHLPQEVQSSIADPDAYADYTADQVIAQSASPWIRFYMNYDPLPVLRQVKCPILMLFGELDTQVLPSQNSDLMVAALTEAGNTDVTAVILPRANHLFQEAITGNPAEYGMLSKAFIPSFFETIGMWLQERQ